jgi:hypothetical protein
MAAGDEISVRLIGAGVMAIVAALAFWWRTPGGGPDWVGITMAVAGLVVVIAGVIPRFRSGAPRTGEVGPRSCRIADATRHHGTGS